MPAHHRQPRHPATCAECLTHFLARGFGAVVCPAEACIRKRRNRQNQERSAARRARAKGATT
jgi:hypothetical protein